MRRGKGEEEARDQEDRREPYGESVAPEIAGHDDVARSLWQGLQFTGVFPLQDHREVIATYPEPLQLRDGLVEFGPIVHDRDNRVSGAWFRDLIPG